tara:strand:+ start:110 stop:661 length:552 start_codon:yes stop_codon:yes gene_type:complete
VWIEIPKNASRTLKEFYRPVNTVVKKEDLQKYNKFKIVLRDPVERFRSLLSHYFLLNYDPRDIRSGKHRYGIEWLQKHYPYLWQTKKINTTNLCDIIMRDIFLLKDIEASHHFNSQSYFIPDEILSFDKNKIEIIDINSLKNTHPILNRSNSQEIKLSAENIDRIKKLYDEDVKLVDKFLKLK